MSTPSSPVLNAELVVALKRLKLGRIADTLNAFNITSLLLGPCFQYAFLRYFTGGEPFSMTGAQFVVD